MTELSILKDLLRNTPHAIVLRSDDSLSVKSLTTFGETIANDIMRGGKVDFTRVPDGFGFTDFKVLTGKAKELIQKDLSDFQSVEPERLAMVTPGMRGKSLVERNVMGRLDSRRAPSGVAIASFKNPDAKVNIIDFKASKFKSVAKFGSVISTINRNGIGFNSARNLLVGRKSNDFSPIAIERITAFVGEGNIRRFMNIKNGNTLSAQLNRRITRRLESLVPKDYSQQKSLEHRFSEALMSRLG